MSGHGGLHVGIDARELLGRRTGVGRYLAELLARWTRLPDYANARLTLYAPAPLDGSWIGEGGASVTPRIVAGGSGTRWEQTTLSSAAGRDELDVFFAPAYSLPLRLRTPAVVAMHDVSFAAHPEWFPWREGLRRRWLARWSASRAAAVLTLTEFSRSEILDHLGATRAKVRVIPPAVDTHPALDGLPPSTAAREPLVLFVGSIFNRRHVPSLLRAFALLRRTLPQARLAIVGENRTHPHEHIPGLIEQLGLGECVDLLDYVDDATLSGLYARARAFAFLSEYEGFGLTPLEAMARGVPAVLLDTPVARESCGDAADYVSDPNDRERLRDALHRLLTDDAYHASRAAAGVAAASRYSWDRTAAETFSVLASSGQGTVGSGQ